MTLQVNTFIFKLSIKQIIVVWNKKAFLFLNNASLYIKMLFCKKKRSLLYLAIVDINFKHAACAQLFQPQHYLLFALLWMSLCNSSVKLTFAVYKD